MANESNKQFSLTETLKATGELIGELSDTAGTLIKHYPFSATTSMLTLGLGGGIILGSLCGTLAFVGGGALALMGAPIGAGFLINAFATTAATAFFIPAAVNAIDHATQQLSLKHDEIRYGQPNRELERERRERNGAPEGQENKNMLDRLAGKLGNAFAANSPRGVDASVIEPALDITPAIALPKSGNNF